jgi:hypothetical protein
MLKLLVAAIKNGNHGKSKGLLASAEPKEIPEINTDATECVLAAVKELKENYEQHYAQIQSRVKQSLEGPVKTFTMDDGIPIVMQLSVWYVLVCIPLLAMACLVIHYHMLSKELNRVLFF